MKRELALEFSRVTEAAALAGHAWLGRGDKNLADGAAVNAMRAMLNRLDIRGRGYAYALKHQLRSTDATEDLRRILPAALQSQVLASPFRANRILLVSGQFLGDLRRQGKISDIIFCEMDQALRKLETLLGGCERLDNTPIPFAYSLILHRTVYLFCTLLPFSLVTELHYMTVLVSAFISYTFLSLDSLAEELEQPFGTAGAFFIFCIIVALTICLSLYSYKLLPSDKKRTNGFNEN